MKRIFIILPVAIAIVVSGFFYIRQNNDKQQAAQTTNTTQAVVTPQPTPTPAVQRPVAPPPTLQQKATPNTNVKKGEGIAWKTFEEVQKKMKKEPRKIFVDVYTHWCGPCKLMDRNTFSNPAVVKYINENYYAVKFNAQQPESIKFNGNDYGNPNYDPARGQMRRNATHQLAGAFGVRAFPTLVFVNEDLELMQAVPGYKTPQQLEPVLRFLGEDAYKSTSWNEYVQNFESTFF